MVCDLMVSLRQRESFLSGCRFHLVRSGFCDSYAARDVVACLASVATSPVSSLCIIHVHVGG
jgi:hypothetical protein